MRACAEPCCSDLPDSPTFAKPCRADSPDSPTFAELCCADSPDSPTFAEPCCADSTNSLTLAEGHFREKCDSPRHIRTSNSPFSRIWREWPLLTFRPKKVRQPKTTNVSLRNLMCKRFLFYYFKGRLNLWLLSLSHISLLDML